MEEYIPQQRKILRKVKKDIYNKLLQRGMPSGQKSYAFQAKLFHSWYSVEEVRFEMKMIMSKVYSDRFIPAGKDAADCYHQNNLICCCLMQLIAPPNIEDIGEAVPVFFIEINHDEGLRLETQNFIYSRLSMLLDKPKNRESYHDSLIKSILQLGRRVKELEKRNGIST